MAVLRDREAVLTASDEDLLETYREMTGKLDAPPFTMRSIAEIQTSMAMLAGQYAAEQLGVPKDQGKTVPLTLAELTARVQHRSTTGAHAAALNSALAPTTGTIMASKEAKKTKTPKAEKAEAAAPAQRGRKPINATFKLTGEGTTNVRETSNRGQILKHMGELPGKKATSDELNATFGRNTLGDLRVLVRLGHLVEVA